MFGKHFGAMYEGSLVGAGAHVFAVMGYVIAKQVPDRAVGSQVDLNPKLLAAILGESEERVVVAIEFLCAPDEESRTDAKEGRRLIRLGQFSYQVVNGAKYRAMRDDEARRESNREAKRRERKNKKEILSGKPLAGEQAYEKALERGDEAGAAAVLAGLEKEEKVANGAGGGDGAGGGEIPEIPLRGAVIPGGGDFTGKWDFQTAHPKKQNFMTGAQADPQVPEPPTESGQWVDGKWEPD